MTFSNLTLSLFLILFVIFVSATDENANQVKKSAEDNEQQIAAPAAVNHTPCHVNTGAYDWCLVPPSNSNTALYYEAPTEEYKNFLKSTDPLVADHTEVNSSCPSADSDTLQYLRCDPLWPAAKLYTPIVENVEQDTDESVGVKEIEDEIDVAEVVVEPTENEQSEKNSEDEIDIADGAEAIEVENAEQISEDEMDIAEVAESIEMENTEQINKDEIGIAEHEVAETIEFENQEPQQVSEDEIDVSEVAETIEVENQEPQQVSEDEIDVSEVAETIEVGNVEHEQVSEDEIDVSEVAEAIEVENAEEVSEDEIDIAAEVPESNESSESLEKNAEQDTVDESAIADVAEAIESDVAVKDSEEDLLVDLENMLEVGVSASGSTSSSERDETEGSSAKFAVNTLALLLGVFFALTLAKFHFCQQTYSTKLQIADDIYGELLMDVTEEI